LLSFNKIEYPKDSGDKSKILLGSFVTINAVWSWNDNLITPNSHCISYTRTPSALQAQNNDTFKSYFSSTNKPGFRLLYKKEKTNLIQECRNEMKWMRDLFSDDGVEFIGKSFDTNRITNRDYIRSQYAGKSQLINKNKFSILFNGFYSTSNPKQPVYFNGYYGNKTYSDSRASVKDSIIGSIVTDSSNVKIIIGNGAFKDDNYVYHPYFTMKLYEVLVYKNIAGLSTARPQRIICDYLISKYKNKAFFDSSEIQTDAPIYYSQADRPNIFGKVQKII